MIHEVAKGFTIRKFLFVVISKSKYFCVSVQGKGHAYISRIGKIKEQMALLKCRTFCFCFLSHKLRLVLSGAN